MEIKHKEFTKEMKGKYTILIPDMLPIHFKLMTGIFNYYGYNTVALRNSSQNVVDEGLKSVHNDTCYPALLVIGQFLDALRNGGYDKDRTALMITQTGGGCRASNYIHLLRKALAEEFPNVPVISLSFTGMEKNSGFKLNYGQILKLLYSVLYGDLLMLLYNQCKPYELNLGESDKVLDECEKALLDKLDKGGYSKLKKNYRYILNKFAAIARSGIKKPRVGIVGEIYVKYSPLANNDLEKFLISEGCEPVVPGLLDFVLYCVINMVNDGKIYKFKDKTTFLSGIGYKILLSQHKKMIKEVKKHGVFDAPHDFEHLRTEADKIINQGVKMGEGWLIPAEMGMLAKSGTENIICTQPFGCLPNHIVAKGISRKIKEEYPEANIVAVDYDPSATKVNQENRIKLMLSNIKKPPQKNE